MAANPESIEQPRKRILTDRQREAMRQGGLKGGAAVREAFKMRQVEGNGEGIDAEVKLSTLGATPAIVARWIRGALGRIKGWPAQAQIEAGKLVLTIAGVSLAPRAGGSGPLAEMSLSDLAASLTESLEATRNLMALENHASQVSDSVPDTFPNPCTSPDPAPVDLAPVAGVAPSSPPAADDIEPTP